MSRSKHPDPPPAEQQPRPDGSPVPRPRKQTDRQALRQLLRDDARTVAELSELARLSQREVCAHLEAIGQGRNPLSITPARCLACGFVFQQRTRIKRPGRCPDCRSGRIAPPRFSMS